MRIIGTAIMGAWLALIGGWSELGVAHASQLYIESQPPRATVVCDGKTYETTPLTITNLPAGEYLVILRKPNYVEARRNVTLEAGARSSITVPLDRVRGLLLIHSKPAGAAVEIDGAARGTTPLLITDLALGNRRATLTSAGYKPMTIEIEITDRTPKKVTVELISNTGGIDISSTPPGAAIRLNGAEVGRTPHVLQRVPLGQNELVLSLAGYELSTHSVELDAGQQITIDATLVALPGALTVLSTPTNAKVYVQGKLRGRTPVTLSNLDSGDYALRVEKAGYADAARSVQVRKAQALTEEFLLERNSGILDLVTEPAGVHVYIDGEDYGVTRSGESDQLSEPLRVDLLSMGEHTLQLTKKGYFERKEKIEIVRDETLTQHIKLGRRFIPDTEIVTKGLNRNLYRGVISKRFPNGDIELEEYENIFVIIEKKHLVRVRPLRTNRKE